MKFGWIIPDREQTGTVLVDWDGHITPLHKSLDLRKLPKAFTLGIPEELVAQNYASPKLFSQIARLEGGASLFAASLEAGVDTEGRAVVLTLLGQLGRNEELSQSEILSIHLPASEVEYGEKLLKALEVDLQCGRSSLSSMLKATKQFPARRTFASEYLSRSANPPDWMEKKSLWGRIMRWLMRLWD